TARRSRTTENVRIPMHGQAPSPCACAHTRRLALRSLPGRPRSHVRSTVIEVDERRSRGMSSLSAQRLVRAARVTVAVCLGAFAARGQTVCDGGPICNGCPTASQTFHCAFPLEAPVNDEVRTCTMPAFDPSLGHLLGVKLTATITGADARFQIENLAPVPC